MRLQFLPVGPFELAIQADETWSAGVHLEVLPYVRRCKEAAPTVRTMVRKHTPMYVLVVLEALSRSEALVADVALEAVGVYVLCAVLVGVREFGSL